MNRKDLKWIDDDYNYICKYGFSTGSMLEIYSFLEAKKRYLLECNEQTRVDMKQKFLYAHTSLKNECASHKISPHTRDELTELLRKGV